MTIAELIRRKRSSAEIATATVATPATPPQASPPTIATIATVAVASRSVGAAECDERAGQAAEMLRLLDFIAKANPGYWSAALIQQEFAIGMANVEAALQTFRAIAKGYGLPQGDPWQ